jgi:hypothetical protein
MDYITRLAKESTGKEDEYDAPLTDTYAGVWYSSTCYHGPRDCCKSQADLRGWFAKRRTLGSIPAYLRQIFVHKKMIIGVIDCMNERFYALLVNNSAGCATTQLKKSCGSGQFGNPIDIERQTLNVVPYLHEE